MKEENTSILILRKYLEKRELDKFLKSKEISYFIDNYWWWFKSTDFLKINLKEPSVISQKLSVRLVISFSLIEGLYSQGLSRNDNFSQYGSNVIKNFFYFLRPEEKFLLLWLIEMRNPIPKDEIKKIEEFQKKDAEKWVEKLSEITRPWYKKEKERIKKERKELLSSLIAQNYNLINEKFSEIIEYLYAWRSQVVHRGGRCLIPARFIFPAQYIKKTVYIEAYPQKKIRAKILNFVDVNYFINFEDIFEDLIFISLLRKEKVKLKPEFEEQWKRIFKMVLSRITKFEFPCKYNDIDNYLQKIG